MADEDSNQQPTIEERASEMGWKPKEEWKGDPAQWRSAEEFVQRGEEVLPIVQSTNRRLRETVEQQNTRLLELERINRANAKALEELQEANREATVQNSERTIEQIEAGIAAARESGDVQQELSLLREHHTATDKLIKAKQKPAASQTNGAGGGSQPQDMTQTPAWRQFVADNPWFQTDSVMRAAAVALQADMLTDGRLTADMDQATRLSKVATEVRKRFRLADNGRRNGANRVEGGGGDGGASSSSGKTFADLPSDAKEACDKAAKRLTFGEGKRYKDLAAWRQSYTNTYFST